MKELKIYCPIELNTLITGCDHSQTFEVVEEILDLSDSLTVNIISDDEAVVSIKLCEGFESAKTKEEIQETTLIFEVFIPFEPEKIQYRNINSQDVSDGEKEMHFDYLAASGFKTEIFAFLLLGQISNPGKLILKQGEVCVDGIYEDDFNAIYCPSITTYTFNVIEKFNWPRFNKVKFIDVWLWCKRNKVSIHTVSSSKVERAINAFSMLFNDKSFDEALHLFWTLIGLEALYCEGTGGLAEQIHTKTQLVLGPLHEYKKRIKKMYGFRSRFIHGDLDIPPIHHEFAEDRNEAFKNELFETVAFSISIIIASFQYLVINDQTRFDFDYVLRQ